METIGDRIKAMRKKNGWTQRELAARLEVNENSIHHWEKMKHLPDVIMIVELSELFGVTTDYILKG